MRTALIPSGLEDEDGEVDVDGLDEDHWPEGLDSDEETGISSVVRL